ncbi:hypothetical protein Z946_2275 [Sulfitobacter noctilucicola]|nr:hypothetical protein Z946_2275 [Sulfitobacter noctilucicola]
MGLRIVAINLFPFDLNVVRAFQEKRDPENPDFAKPALTGEKQARNRCRQSRCAA